MKAFWMALSLLICSYYSMAQQYIIRYDLAGENINYYRIRKPGDTVAAPVIQMAKTSRVNLQLVNAANSYQQRITYIERVETRENIVIPGLGSTPTPRISGNGLADIDEGALNNPDLTKSGGIKMNEIDERKETSQQQAAKQLFVNNYNAYAAAYRQWQKTMLFEQRCRVLWKDLAGLRYSMQSPATEVKLTAKKRTEDVFPGSGNDPAAILMNDNAANMQSAYTAVKSSYTALLASYTSMQELEIISASADSLMKGAYGGAELVKKNYNPAATNDPDAIVNRISEMYQQILNDSYTQTIPLDIKRKTVMARISFIPVIDSVTAAALNYKQGDTISRLVPIYKKEPLRFRNTFGFSFASFAENRWNYFISPDSVITRESADQFQPLVSTYLHFYAPRDRGFRWGGTFGAGLPLTGDKNINIMLGLSTFLGKNDPVCITAGVAGAQVKKLTGWKPGDKVDFTTLESRHYNSVYRLGYFLSLTFNPGSLNLND
jgi:hypothetical protein